MAINTLPAFSKTPNIAWSGNITAANIAKDGTGTTSLIYTAGADGGIFNKVICKPTGTNVPSLARLFMNNGSTPSTASNNSYIDDIPLQATTLIETAAMAEVVRVLNIVMPPNYRIYVSLATAVAAGWSFTGFGASY